MKITFLIAATGCLVMGITPPPSARGAEPADVIFTAGTVFTGQTLQTSDTDTRPSSAVAVRDGRIVAVGEPDSLAGLIGPTTRRVELSDNQTLLPGLIESHGHFVGLGQSLMMLDLRNQSTWNDVVADVARAAADRPAGTWIVGRGWHQSKWSVPPRANVDGYPIHTTLSEAVPDHPVLLTHASGHATFANGEAMRRARVDADTPDPAGGEILRDDAGIPTGLFRERASALITAARVRDESGRDSAAEAAEFREAVRLATEECWRYGITSFHDAGSSFHTAAALRELAEAGELGVRLYVMIRDSNDALGAQLAKARVVGAGNGFFTVRAIKKSIDGALGPHGAWLLEPYEDLPSSRGLATLDPDVVQKAARMALANGYQVCVHAIGDRANREVLDIYQRVADTQRLPNLRWRIEHAQHLHPDDIPRFGKLGVIAAAQGVHCTSDAIFVPRRLGYRRSATGAYPWRSLIEGGAVLCNGTDAPVESLDPFPSLQASMTRQLADGSVFFPGQVMTRDEALQSYTINAAFAAFEETSKGSIEIGKMADLIVVDANLATLPATDWSKVRTTLTMIDGKIVYEAAGEGDR